LAYIGKIDDANLLDWIDSTWFIQVNSSWDQIQDNTIDSTEIQNNTITYNDISDGTVRTTEITNNTILNADINSAAAIAGSKISPDFGTQNVTTGQLFVTPGGSYPYVQIWNQSNDKMYADNSTGDTFGWGIWFRVANNDNSAYVDALKIKENWRVEIAYDPASGDDLWNRDYNDARYVNVSEWISGDVITDGTIDSTEIQDNTLTANDLAADSVGDSEMINNPSFSSVTVTDSAGFIWENWVNSITHNDGGWNVQIRFGHDYTSSAERFTHAWTAFNIGWSLDSSGGALELKVASNGWAGNDQAVTWWPALVVWQSSLTWNGSSVLTAASTIDADTLDGYNSSQSSTVSTVAVRDASWDINARIFRSEYDTTNSNVWFIMTQVNTGTNNYIRPTTPAQFRSAVTDSSYINVGSSWDQIADGTIDSTEIQNNTLTQDDIAADSIFASELGNNSVGSANVIDNSLTHNDVNLTCTRRATNNPVDQRRTNAVCLAWETVTWGGCYSNNGVDVLQMTFIYPGDANQWSPVVPTWQEGYQCYHHGGNDYTVFAMCCKF
jgi:hypothetical protein